ncbi:hypothetical protein [Ramlibacter sp. AN1133]|uniref:hypothetical protein n=1 Tax=Ramlibacter sp. AN1133 TaxID=3133429 RepID=UPI0030C266C8
MPIATVRRLLSRRRSLAWLLALVLWLPVAQWVAATHSLLHLPTATADDSERAAHPPGSCNTCVVAAAMLGAAPACEFGAPAAQPLRHAQPPTVPAPFLPLPQRPPYHSRAPPLLHA